MSELRATPGPWKADLDRYPIFVESETEQWPLPDEGEGLTSAFVANVGENKANAHLIAAAPELYAVLEYVRDILGPHDGWADDSKRMIDAALKKARGE